MSPNGSTETSVRRTNPFSYRVRNRLQRVRQRLQTTLFTDVGGSLLIASLSIICIVVILTARYLTPGNIIQVDISPRDIYADRLLEIEDKSETRRLQYEARELVAPVYQRSTASERMVSDRMVDLLENIESVRDNHRLSNRDKLGALTALWSERDLPRQDILQRLLTTPHWKDLYEAGNSAVKTLITRGIRSDELRFNREYLIRDAIHRHANLAIEDENALVAILASKIRPTLIIDEQSTEEARDIAVSHIKPVIEVYNKGDLIVKRSERITDVQRAALMKMGGISGQNGLVAVAGIILLAVCLLGIVWSYIFWFEHRTYFKPAYSGLISSLMIAAVAGLTMMMDLQPQISIELYPIPILSLMLCIFTHPRIAILTTLMILLLSGLALKIPMEDIAALVISSMAGIFMLARKPVPSDRNDLILAGLGVGVAYGWSIMATGFIYDPISEASQWALFYRMGIGVFMGLLTGIFILGALPILESWFKLVTPYTLLELGNHDRPMLRRLQVEAPGTFHHSVMVANLSEAAAEAIGANSILTRVGALYHDIGKMKRPLFFVENQAYFGVENPHDKLTPRLSKMVVTAHPRDGVEMGKQIGLPPAILRFMPEHHGTLLAGYFYNRAILEEGEDNVNKAHFRYPGPKPQSKETAIVMLADACESAVRALKNPTLSSVEDRVDKIFRQRVDDGQFNECPLSFQELQTVRDTFVRVLRGIQHNRIEYQQTVLNELSKKAIPEPILHTAPPLPTQSPPTPSLTEEARKVKSPALTMTESALQAEQNTVSMHMIRDLEKDLAQETTPTDPLEAKPAREGDLG